MTKQAELDILRDTIARLGPNSYLGPWLEDQLPWIESDMRSDIPPMSSWTESRARIAAERAESLHSIERAESACRERCQSMEKSVERTFANASRLLRTMAAELER
jgi:hypothetical protein